MVDTFIDPGRVSPAFGNFDFPFSDFANLNRAGFDYQGDYVARSWARTTVGYHFEDENGWVGDLTSLPLGHGLRRNHAVFGQEVLTWRRVTVIAGARFEHNESFGNRGLPRIAASVLALKGGEIFSGTRLRFAYGTGIKEPRLEESFGVGGFGIIPNPNLKAEENRSLEAGVQQSFVRGQVLAGRHLLQQPVHQPDRVQLRSGAVCQPVPEHQSRAGARRGGGIPGAAVVAAERGRVVHLHLNPDPERAAGVRSAAERRARRCCAGRSTRHRCWRCTRRGAGAEMWA